VLRDVGVGVPVVEVAGDAVDEAVTGLPAHTTGLRARTSHYARHRVWSGLGNPQ
jgi:hypothetical protein